MLTPEQKKSFGPMLQRTYEAIADDANCQDVEEIVEVTCDANHPETYGGMTREEYQILSREYHDPDTQAWLRQILNYEITSEFD